MGVHLASPRPVRCSACYQAFPDMPHVDFEAATDGPVFVDPKTGAVEVYEAGNLVTVEEIIICQSCINAAAELLSIEPQTMADLRVELAEARGETEKWKGRAEGLALAASEWNVKVNWDHEPQPQEPPPEQEEADAKPAPNPRREGYPPEVRAHALEQVQAGRTLASVAREHGVSVQTIRNWRKRMEKEAQRA